MKKILVLGYMGSGKSILGKLVAERLQIPSYDLDQIIENQLQMTIPEIFQQKGEIYFRKIEHQIFHEFMANKESFVLSLGGGTPCYANNHLLLQSTNTTSIYLKASIDTLHLRLASERKTRPLLAQLSDEEVKEYIAKHLFERSYFYMKASLSVAVDHKTPQQISDEILKLLA